MGTQLGASSDSEAVERVAQRHAADPDPVGGADGGERLRRLDPPLPTGFEQPVLVAPRYQRPGQRPPRRTRGVVAAQRAQGGCVEAHVVAIEPHT